MIPGIGFPLPILNKIVIPPYFVDFGADSVQENSLSISVYYPTTVDANDILIACVCEAETTGQDCSQWTVPDGWQSLHSFADNYGADKFAGLIAWKYANGTEGGTAQTFTGSLSSGNNKIGQIYRFKGGDSSKIYSSDKTYNKATITRSDSYNYIRMPSVATDSRGGIALGFGFVGANKQISSNSSPWIQINFRRGTNVAAFAMFYKIMTINETITSRNIDIFSPAENIGISMIMI